MFTKISAAIFCVILVMLTLTNAKVAQKHSNRRQSTTVANCKYRTQHYMDKKLLELRTRYESGQQARMKRRSSELNEAESVDMSEVEHLFEETGCVDKASNKTLQYERHKSTCPWEVVTKERDDSWPIRVAEAKCTCSQCNSVDDVVLSKGIYRCMPVMIQSPVLLREDECDAEGFYKWSEAIELINYGCTCALSLNLIIN
jgi:hypothetical protein